MRKIFILFAAVLMTASMWAEEETTYTLVIPSRSKATLECDGNIYFYGRDAMKQSQMLDWYAQQNCRAAYIQFAQGQRMAKAGWALLGIGAAMEVGSITCGIIYWHGHYATGGTSQLTPRDQSSGSGMHPLRATSIGLGVGAAACEATCIPLLIVGYHKMHSSVDIYNASCNTARIQPYWTIQASQNGLGLALNF